MDTQPITPGLTGSTAQARFRLGIASLFGFVTAQALRDVYLGRLFADLGLYEVATLAFGTSALVFGAVLLLFARHQIALLRAQWRLVLILNGTTALAWLSYFQALRMVEPAAVNLAFCGVAPAAVALFARAGLSSAGEARAGITARLVHAALLALVVLLAAIVAGGLSGFARIDPLIGLGGVALAALAGFAITAETIFAKRMNVAGVSPVALVGVRFLLVTAIAVSMLAVVPAPYAGLTPAALLLQAGVFLVILIGPIYLVQLGIALTSPLVCGVISCLGPVLTLALQSAGGGIALSWPMLALTGVYALLSVTAATLATTR